jgi:hypothetical protein
MLRVLRVIGRRLTYANVIASLALFLALGGGAVYAASHKANKVGTGKLKQNAVTAGKIKANAVTQTKIRNNAVTNAKLRQGAVNLEKIAAGTNLIGTASSPAIAVNGASAVPVSFSAPLSFTPTAGSLYMLSVEARGTNLARSGTEPCRVTVVPLVNGAEWNASDPLVLSAFEPTAEAPSGTVPAAGQTSPIGLAAPGVTETIGAKLIGSPRCASTSSAAVAVAVTQFK